ncbi:MAG: GGDEF domain-containing protein [Uliginosibacterium sp.]|nr:GGDEF domain-containing protein [Uliginosibacterium sp.]
MRDEHGEIINYVQVFLDISRLKASEERLDYLAHHDPLTQLPNRLLLFSRLDHALATARRDGGVVALLMFDLDRFKDINDSFGHLQGDQLLLQVAERLSARLRAGDFFARLGGDEFTVLLDGLSRPEDAARVAGEIIHNLAQPFRLSNGAEIQCSASIGISLFPATATRPRACCSRRIPPCIALKPRAGALPVFLGKHDPGGARPDRPGCAAAARVGAGRAARVLPATGRHRDRPDRRGRGPGALAGPG